MLLSRDGPQDDFELTLIGRGRIFRGRKAITQLVFFRDDMLVEHDSVPLPDIQWRTIMYSVTGSPDSGEYHFAGMMFVVAATHDDCP